MPVKFAPCECDLTDERLLMVREGFLSTVNSILKIFDNWERQTVIQGRVKFVLLEQEKCGIIIDGLDSCITFPLICGTRMWIEWLEKDPATLTSNGLMLAAIPKIKLRSRGSGANVTMQPPPDSRSWDMECGFCKIHTSHVPTTLTINGVVYFQQIYSVFDSARPQVNARTECESSCFIDGERFSNSAAFKSTNPILITSGALPTQRLYPISQTFVKKLTRLIDWAVNGSLAVKQAQVESHKLFVGAIDGIFSARAAYKSHEDFDGTTQSRLVSGFERNSGSRYQQLKMVTIQRLVFPLSLYKLIRTSHHITSNRLLHPCEEGFLAIGFVTESENAGMQYTTVLGIEFEESKTWAEFKEIVESFNYPSNSVNVLWSDMVVRQLQLPCSASDQVTALGATRCDFTTFCDGLYYAASFPATATTKPLNSQDRFTCITLDYIRQLTKLTLPNLGILDFTIPCLNSSHAPKVMQSEYHLKQSINPYAPSASPREVGKMFASPDTVTPPLGAIIKNVPTVETIAQYKVDLFNEEDGVVLSQDYAAKLEGINFRTATIAAKGLINVHRVFPCDIPISPDDIIIQIEASTIALTSAYFSIQLERKGLWNLRMKRDYSTRSVYIDSIVVSDRGESSSIMVAVISRHDTLVGDKLTTLHGQKCTAGQIRADINHDMIISATCLKRMPFGEFLYGAIVNGVKAGRLPLSMARQCFGYDWLFMSKDEKNKLLATVIGGEHNATLMDALNGDNDAIATARHLLTDSDPTIIIYTMRLTQESDTIMSFATVGTIDRDPWVGQNRKGLVNTGASCITLPGMQSLERQGMTRCEYMIRRSAECPDNFTIFDGVAIDKSAKMTLQIFGQFNTFNLDFK